MLIQDVPTVIESAPSRSQQRRVSGCEWCSNCGHVSNESTDSLPALVPVRSEIANWNMYPVAKAWMAEQAAKKAVGL